MDITNKNIPHLFRNKYLKNTGGSNNSNNIVADAPVYIGGGGLPYTLDEDGNYVISKRITVEGDILSIQNVVAYASDYTGGTGSYLPLSGGSVSGDITAYNFIKSGSTDDFVLLGSGGTYALSGLTGSTTGIYLPLSGGTLSGTANIVANNFIKSGSSNSYFLLGSGSTTPISGYTTYSAFTGHTANTTAHTTQNDKNFWNNMLPLSGGSMTGNVSFPYDVPAIQLRSTSSSYGAWIGQDNSGVESTIFANQYSGSSFKFKNGFPMSSMGSGAIVNMTDYDFMISASGNRSNRNFSVSGNCTVSGTIVATGEITAFSDKRLKKNVKLLKNRGKLKPIVFEKDNKRQLGFIAQDVQKIYPELITVDNNSKEKYLSLNYMQLTSVLSAQINELFSLIEDMQKQINDLKCQSQ
ncbi:hypothetical protein EZS27_008305 [termite gut metagenome]|uniref:Peptidase S74 domain-containing protein n=1 Tax=termite gut metagenome TaxID=433724 RepID=A0A5J4SDT6_9ZZZZ